MNIEVALKDAMSLDGALGACLVDWESGMSLGAMGGGKHRHTPRRIESAMSI
jgi:hypothetical protein